MPKVMFRDVSDFGNAGAGLNLLRPAPGLPGAVVSSSHPEWMEVVFSWTSVGGATSYTLQVGTTSGASDYGTYVVGNVLTYTLNLPPGTYYARVVDNFTNTASAEQGPFFA